MVFRWLLRKERTNKMYKFTVFIIIRKNLEYYRIV